MVSNDTRLDPEIMLNYYKGQQTVERGFRFLKDKCFHVSEVYLKKEERIEALCVIMVLGLLLFVCRVAAQGEAQRNGTDCAQSAK